MSTKALKTSTTSGEQEIALTLKDFCVRLSTTERRVELIAGFEADERSKNRLKDTESAYSARYKAFINRPA